MNLSCVFNVCVYGSMVQADSKGGYGLLEKPGHLTWST